MVKDKVQKFYDNCAASFDEEQDNFSFIRGPEKEIVLSTLDKILDSSLEVLEIGAGTGRFTLAIAPRVKNVTTVDISKNMLDNLSQKKEEAKIDNIDQICGDFMEVNFEKRFDLIVSFSAIEYIKDKHSLFKKMSDLLKPGGKLIFTTAHNTFLRFWGRFGNFFRQKIYMAAYRKKEMIRLLASNSLHIVEMKDLCLKSCFSKGVLLFVYTSK